MSNGFILYRGPSQIDGSPIVVIATGLAGKASRNVKTGELVQTWVLRADMAPHDAVSAGLDGAICGTCPHRGQMVDGRNVNRSCYVTPFQAPLSVYRAFVKGVYPEAVDVDEARDMLAGRRVRLGSYGDPAAVPFDVWAITLSKVEAMTGYTHQWRKAPVDFSRFVMASCDSQADYEAAKALGYRTFRVRAAGETVNAKEVVCPASKEAGAKTTCAACVACGGHSAKAKANITILAHGAANKIAAFARNVAA